MATQQQTLLKHKVDIQEGSLLSYNRHWKPKVFDYCRSK